jgi:hypothetical protein
MKVQKVLYTIKQLSLFLNYNPKLLLRMPIYGYEAAMGFNFSMA